MRLGSFNTAFGIEQRQRQRQRQRHGNVPTLDGDRLRTRRNDGRDDRVASGLQSGRGMGDGDETDDEDAHRSSMLQKLRSVGLRQNTQQSMSSTAFVPPRLGLGGTASKDSIQSATHEALMARSGPIAVVDDTSGAGAGRDTSIVATAVIPASDCLYLKSATGLYEAREDGYHWEPDSIDCVDVLSSQYGEPMGFPWYDMQTIRN